MNPWLSPEIAQQQRALVDQQLAAKPWPPHFLALAEAVRATQCPGGLLLIGCGVGHEREVLDRAGVEYRSFSGVDISPTAIAVAKERYPESKWSTAGGQKAPESMPCADVVIDGSCVLHVEDWRAHLAALCRASRRWVILHRVPLSSQTQIAQTHGYGHVFPARVFNGNDIHAEMEKHGFVQMAALGADGDSHTLTYAKKRHFCTYADGAYLGRLKALHASMVRHCGPFELHVLAWDDSEDRDGCKVGEWCEKNGIGYSTENAFLRDREDLDLHNLPGPPRTRIEHMWTVGPAWIAEVRKRTGEPVTYVDADVMFFSSPEPMFAEIGGAPAAVVPHGFAEASRGLPGPMRETHEVFGRFNVGIVYATDRAFVERWAEQCRRWCYDHLEKYEQVILYGDQKWLEDWDHYPGLCVVKHPGACAGPWQIHTRALDVRDGVIHFGNRPLIAYHFSSYREGPHGYDQLSRPEYAINERQAALIYRPYIAALREANGRG